MIFNYQNFADNRKNLELKSEFFIVSTPIGNIEDITIRAIKILSSVDYIVCENHEITKKLLNHYDIDTKLLHYNDDMPYKYLAKIHEMIDSKKSIALVSDAGTPLISDPGHKIVNHAISHNYNIVSIPGPSSFVSALTSSGFSCDKFYFYGFLPKIEKKIILILQDLLKIKSLLIFFESPHRLIKTLELLKVVFGQNKKISISKEITKLYEETFRGTIEEILNLLRSKTVIKGEYVIIVDNSNNSTTSHENIKAEIDNYINELLISTLSTKDMIQKIQTKYPESLEIEEFSKNSLYKLILEKRETLIS